LQIFIQNWKGKYFSAKTDSQEKTLRNRGKVRALTGYIRGHTTENAFEKE